MPELLIDLGDLKKLAKVLRAVEPSVEKEFLRGLAVAGEIVAEQARHNAQFSTRIPATIVVKRRGLRVKIQAGGDPAPEAAPLEHGGIPGTFRHPVFGDRENWVDQPAHPFLTPAVDSKLDEGLVAIASAVDVALRGISVV